MGRMNNKSRPLDQIEDFFVASTRVCVSDFDLGWNDWINRVKFNPAKNDEWSDGWHAARENYLKLLEPVLYYFDERIKNGTASHGAVKMMAKMEEASQTIKKGLDEEQDKKAT
jgi:hypothetical protein